MSFAESSSTGIIEGVIDACEPWMIPAAFSMIGADGSDGRLAGTDGIEGRLPSDGRADEMLGWLENGLRDDGGEAGDDDCRRGGGIDGFPDGCREWGASDFASASR